MFTKHFLRLGIVDFQEKVSRANFRAGARPAEERAAGGKHGAAAGETEVPK